jgi:hypothetical protein
VSGRRFILLAALVAAVALSGCGDDDSGDGSARAKLLVSQASADVEAFCRYKTTTGYLYDRQFILMVMATDTLIAANRRDPELKVWLDPVRPEVPVRKVVRDSAAKLKRCGRDGRQQAARIQRATESG